MSQWFTVRRSLSATLALVSVAFVVVVAGAGAAGGGKLSASVVIADAETPLAQGGPAFTLGMQAAIKQLNAAGGIGGQKLVLKKIPTGGTPEGAISAYRTAGQDKNVMGAFLGASGGSAIKSAGDSVKVPALLAAANRALYKPPAKYIFQSSYDSEYASSAVYYAVKVLKAKSIAVLHYETDFSVQVPSAIKAACAKYGCKVTDVEAGKSTDSVDQLSPQLTKMKASNADAYYIEGLNANAFKAARQLGLFSKPIVSENWLASAPVAVACGDACKGVVFAALKCGLDTAKLSTKDPQRTTCSKWRASYRKAFPGQEYQGYSVYGADAVNIFAGIIKQLLAQNKKVTRDAIATAMANLKGTIRTTHGAVKTTPSEHRTVGPFHDSHIFATVTVAGGKAVYSVAPKADRLGANP